MDQAIVEPEKLRHFASRLQLFCTDITAVDTQARSALGRLGQKWQDQEYTRFAQSFTSLSRHLRAFSERATATVPQLRQDADMAEQYLRIKE